MSISDLYSALVITGHVVAVNDGHLVVRHWGAELFVTIDERNAIIRSALFHTEFKPIITNDVLERIVGHVNSAVRGAKSIINENTALVLSESFATDTNDLALNFINMAFAMLQQLDELDRFSVRVRR